MTALLLVVSERLNWRVAPRDRACLSANSFVAGGADGHQWQPPHSSTRLGHMARWHLVSSTSPYGLFANTFRGRSPALHALSLLAVTGLALWEVAWQFDQLTVGRVWLWVAVSLVPGLALYVVRALYERINWLVAQNLATYMAAAFTALVIMQLGIILALNAQSNGNPAPLAYIPLLNPLDVATGLALVVGLRWLFTVRQTGKWLTRDNLRLHLGALAVVALATSTAALIRAIHHIGDIPWDFDVLFRSVLVQSGLSIYWGILGFTGMVWGARIRQRPVWLVGAGLMATVVIKLFVIDLGNTGTVERIVSFIGTGALLLIVGYFAPVPPRDSTEHSTTNNWKTRRCAGTETPD